MTSWVCVDSNILLKLILNEPDSHLAEGLWQFWINNDLRPVAPYLFPFEITAVIRKSIYRGVIDSKFGQQALRQAKAFDVTLQTFPDIHEQALAFATQLNRPTAYDAHYLALAVHLGCDFWTNDHRLFNTVHKQLPWINWLGNFSQ